MTDYPHLPASQQEWLGRIDLVLADSESEGDERFILFLLASDAAKEEDSTSSLSVDDLAEVLDITAEEVEEHLKRLEVRGHIETVPSKPTTYRPIALA